MLDLEIEPKYHLQHTTIQSGTESVVRWQIINFSYSGTRHSNTSANTQQYPHQQTKSYRLSNNSTWAWQWLVKSWIIRFSVNLVCYVCTPNSAVIWISSKCDKWWCCAAMLMCCGVILAHMYTLGEWTQLKHDLCVVNQALEVFIPISIRLAFMFQPKFNSSQIHTNTHTEFERRRADASNVNDNHNKLSNKFYCGFEVLNAFTKHLFELCVGFRYSSIIWWIKKHLQSVKCFKFEFN